jgi:hypothetical protein
MMFKKTSNAMQSRQRRSVTETTKNTSGVDKSVWKSRDEDQSERSRLIFAKKEVEAKLSKIKRDILSANVRYHNHAGKPLTSSQYQGLLMRKEILVNELNELDKRLLELRLNGDARRNIETNNFGTEFKIMAKELLAEEVYNRIVYATIHRLSEMDGECSSSEGGK